jgi:hypothetical protein
MHSSFGDDPAAKVQWISKYSLLLHTQGSPTVMLKPVLRTHLRIFSGELFSLTSRSESSHDRKSTSTYLFGGINKTSPSLAIRFTTDIVPYHTKYKAKTCYSSMR